jgi:hypothetical protein
METCKCVYQEKVHVCGMLSPCPVTAFATHSVLWNEACLFKRFWFACICTFYRMASLGLPNVMCNIFYHNSCSLSII